MYKFVECAAVFHIIRIPKHAANVRGYKPYDYHEVMQAPE
jgi:hypothetical protein